MFKSKHRELIIKKAEKYYEELESDFSHNFDHFLRVERIAKEIAKTEKCVDFEVLEASTLLFDIAREREDRSLCEDHAEEGAKLAGKLLKEIKFPQEKTKLVKEVIRVHRKSRIKKAETIEALILQEADWIDAMGAVDIARVIGSCFQSKKYNKPIYSEEGKDSAIGYLKEKISNPNLKPENFKTKRGREMAKERYKFMKEYVERFLDEWEGKR